jgi:hypothetical protein
MPEEFTFKLLSKDTFNFGAVDDKLNRPIEVYECSSQGMAISIKAADKSSTSIVVDGSTVYAAGNDVVVKKNGITEQKTVSCTYYPMITTNKIPNYSECEFYAYAAGDSAHKVITHTYYSKAQVFFYKSSYFTNPPDTEDVRDA